MKYIDIASATNYEKQEDLFLALEVADCLEKILRKAGWEPSNREKAAFSKAVCNYIASYKEATLEKNGNWNVVIIQSKLQETAAGLKGSNTDIGRRMYSARKKFLEEARKAGAYKYLLSNETEIFSVVATSHVGVPHSIYPKYKGKGGNPTHTVRFSSGFANPLEIVYSNIL